MARLIERSVTPAADGVVNTFTLPAGAVLGSMAPHLQGIAVYPGDYTELTATTFSLATTPRAGDQVRLYFEINDLSTGASMFSLPVGAIDGVNRSYTTPAAAAYAAGELRIVINGVSQPPNVVDETGPAVGTFDVLTPDPPDPLRDSLLVFWVLPPITPGPIVSCPIKVVVEDDMIVCVTSVDHTDDITVDLGQDATKACVDDSTTTVVTDCDG